MKDSTLSSKIDVGNLPCTIEDASLLHNFSEFGGVLLAKVMRDRDTGSSTVVNISKLNEPSTGNGSGYCEARN